MADDKAPSELNYSDFAKAAQERPEQFQSGIDTLQKVDAGLGGGYRNAISAAQTATSPMQIVDAAKTGFMSPEQAASWQQIAQKAGVDNHYGQLAAAGLGVLTEPTLLAVPGLGKAGKEAEEAKLAWNEMAPSLHNLNTEGKILVSSNPAAEFKAAAKATQEAPIANQTLNFNTYKAREAAKNFAVDAVKKELKAQPAVARDTDYLRGRIQTLFNRFMLHNK